MRPMRSPAAQAIRAPALRVRLAIAGRWSTLALLLAASMLGGRDVDAAPATAADSAGAGPHMPKATDISYYYDNFDNSFVRPITRTFDPARWVRRVSGRPREAANVDAQDQVRLPSTWWQPRIGFRDVSVDQLLAGPGRGTGPAAGKWRVTKAKSQGVTPGFYIEDAEHHKFIVKFDPPSAPELASSADVVSCYLFWGAGYNVPDDAIAFLHLEDLEVKKGATVTDARGGKRPMTREYLLQLMQGLHREADGSYRVLTSRLLDGKPIGPFEYRGRRADDPEDLIPHELRRELRGLWTVAAWTHHADARGPNSLDMFVTEHGRSFVRHHLIDFNGCLGSGSIAPKAYASGFEYFTDWGVAGKQLVTAGVVPFPWEGVVDPHIPSLGFIEGKEFDPAGWRPDYPNPAFDERTTRDIRWGARIVAGFTDDHIRAAVSRGRYSDPRAAEALVQALIQRRDRIVARWLNANATAPGTATR